MTDQELNERLAKAVGFEKRKVDWSGFLRWYSPDGELYDAGLTIPNFTISMDACLKWIVPSIKFVFDLHRLNTGQWECRIVTSTMGGYEAVADTMSLAFCLAADKYFKETTK
jgi:hypothetical protein